jgi:nucleoside phosphorylase
MADPIHRHRKEIARYVLARGIETQAERPPARYEHEYFNYPDGLTPTPASDPAPDADAELPGADVVVITWTVDEGEALAGVFTPGHALDKWHRYEHKFDDFKPNIRTAAPAIRAGRLGSYWATQIGPHNVLCFKSELHLNQDGKSTGEGTATLPVKDLFSQIVEETSAKLILTIGTAGATVEAFGLGDVVVTRAAKFRCAREFRNEPFNDKVYKSDWEIPTAYLEAAESFMSQVADELEEPEIGAPSTAYDWIGPVLRGRGNRSQIRLDGRDMAAFHPILTTDFFEYGTSTNHLEREGCGVEMGDAALGLACSELADPPNWAVIRNMSDPVINGELPADEYHLNSQTTWAVGYYTAYGRFTSICGALATWGVIGRPGMSVRLHRPAPEGKGNGASGTPIAGMPAGPSGSSGIAPHSA